MRLVRKRTLRLWFSKSFVSWVLAEITYLLIIAFRYPSTKLLEIYAVRQLASLLPVSRSGVVVNVVSPGFCYSELDRNVGTIPRMGIAVMRKLLARTAEEGSRNLLQAAFAGPESHGAYCSECQVKEYVSPFFCRYHLSSSSLCTVPLSGTRGIEGCWKLIPHLCMS